MLKYKVKEMHLETRKKNTKNIAIRLENQIDSRLSALAKQTGRTKTFYIKQALIEFLENKEDYLLGLAVLENTNEKEYTLEELEKELNNKN